MESAFERRTAFHSFNDITVMVGNGEAYEAKAILDAVKDLRNEWISMMVVRPRGSDEDYYIGLLTIPDLESRGRLFKEHDNVLITWEQAPIMLLAEERGPGVKAPKDKPWGWRAVVLSDDKILSSIKADVVLLLERPRNPLNPLKDRMMPHLGIIKVLIKICPSSPTVKGRLNALDQHRHFRNPDGKFNEKRRLLIGRDLSVNPETDLLKGLSEEEIDEMAKKLNERQKECFTKYLRHVPNNLALIQGAFGSGKTMLVHTVAEALVKQGKSVLITTSTSFRIDIGATLL